MLSFARQYFFFITKVFDEYFVGLKKIFERCIKPHEFLSVRCCMNDPVYEIPPFRIYWYLFHYKKGFNVVSWCQQCKMFFVDAFWKSCPLQRQVLRMSLSQISCPQRVFFNVCYTDIVESIETDAPWYSHKNISALFYDTVVHLLYHFYLEIYVRLLFNLMKRNYWVSFYNASITIVMILFCLEKTYFVILLCWPVIMQCNSKKNQNWCRG